MHDQIAAVDKDHKGTETDEIIVRRLDPETEQRPAYPDFLQPLGQPRKLPALLAICPVRLDFVDSGDRFGNLAGGRPGKVDSLLVGFVRFFLQNRNDEHHDRIDYQGRQGQFGVQPDQVTGEGEECQDVADRHGKGHPGKAAGGAQLGHKRGYYRAGLRGAEKVQRQGKDVVVKTLPHGGHGPFADNRLQVVDRKLETAGHSNRQDINGAVEEEPSQVLQGNRIVDDPLLHFQRD
ncbi:MAG: hypothetical protein ACD_75C01111G0001, partial [uncultured bacterium]